MYNFDFCNVYRQVERSGRLLGCNSTVVARREAAGRSKYGRRAREERTLARPYNLSNINSGDFEFDGMR